MGTSSSAATGRDIVTIGGSAGSIEPILSISRNLPERFPAAVFVVVHSGAQPGHLPELLQRSTGMPAAYAVHGERIMPGRIYIAPPDNHMTLEPDVVRVFRGPRENSSRPAIDPLFRSAARAYGRRVIGVIVSGMLDCGAHGMRLIHAVGGVTVVQDPNEALFPDMPRAVADPDYVLPIAEIPSRLAFLVAEQPRGHNGRKFPVSEEKVAADMSCPGCHGPLSELSEGHSPEFTCHMGHAYSLAGLADEQARDLESALWSALRSLRESERVSRRLMPLQPNGLQQRFHEKAEALARHAQLIEDFLLDRTSAETVHEAGRHPFSKPLGSTHHRARSLQKRVAARRHRKAPSKPLAP